MQPDRQAIRRFLRRVHGDEPAGWLIIFTRQDSASRAFSLADTSALDRAVEYCAAQAAAYDVHAVIGLQHKRPDGGARGDEAGVSVLPGLWADVDIVGPSHSATNLPPSEKEARELIATLGLKPTIIVHTGFGLQSHWLLREPYRIESDEERQRLKSLSSRLQLSLRLHANARAWTMDSTADLCRPLRVPGTFNRKVHGDVRLVTAEYSDYSYILNDFEEVLTGIDDARERSPQVSSPLDLPPARLPDIIAACSWMRRCQDDAARLPEPEWYRMLTVVARCEEAEKWAHELSKPYPKYTRKETNRKLKQASRDTVGPVTCHYVETSLNGAKYCANCLFKGHINSPIAIGRIEEVETGFVMTDGVPAAGDHGDDGNQDGAGDHEPDRKAPVSGTGAADVFSLVAPYPAPIGPEAYYGIAGEFVYIVEPHTEADPSFLLVSFLIYAGNILGRYAYIWAGGDKHYTNLFGVGVGPTSSGRKGSAAGPVEWFFRGIDEDWVKAIQSGLSSGEGLIWAVRDPVMKREQSKDKSGPPQSREVEVDAGIKDKRLLVRQSEFYGVLQVMRRQGNTLSPVIRDAWDRGDLNSMVKNSPARATGAHISILANITKDELLRGMLRDEADNGFANRFLWCCSRRSRSLPEGGKLYKVEFSGLQRRFELALLHGRKLEAVARNEDAADLWGRDDRPGDGMYSQLTSDRHGLFGAVTARAAAQVLRLSLIYALLDSSSEIRSEHLLAAYEVWRYCQDSAKYIFGDATGDPTADEILMQLRKAPEGLTRVQISGIFLRHKASGEITRALLKLHTDGLARFERKATSGRPVETWFAVGRT